MTEPSKGASLTTPCANCGHERRSHGDLQIRGSEWCIAPASGERAKPFTSICNCAAFVELVTPPVSPPSAVAWVIVRGPSHLDYYTGFSATDSWHTCWSKDANDARRFPTEADVLKELSDGQYFGRGAFVGARVEEHMWMAADPEGSSRAPETVGCNCTSVASRRGSHDKGCSFYVAPSTEPELIRSVPSGEPVIDVERLTTVLENLLDAPWWNTTEEANANRAELRALASALPSLVAASERPTAMETELVKDLNDANRRAMRYGEQLAETLRDREDAGERVSAWLANLREAMPGQTYTSPTGESIVGAAINRLQELTAARSNYAALLVLEELHAKQNDEASSRNALLESSLGASQERIAELEKELAIANADLELADKGNEAVTKIAKQLRVERDEALRGIAAARILDEDMISRERAVKAIEALPQFLGCFSVACVLHADGRPQVAYLERPAVLAALSEKADG